LIFILFLWFFPFKNIQPNALTTIQYKRKKAQNLMLIIGSFSLIALIFFSYYSYKLFTSLDLTYARDIIQEEAFLPSGPLTAFLVIVSSLYFVNLFLFFFSLKEKYSKLYPILMLVSSLSFPFMVLCYFGRDGALYWVANFIVLYFLFNKILLKNVIRKTKRIAFIILAALFTIFFIVTISRFGNDFQRTYVALLSYSGQQFQNFSEAYSIKTSTYRLLPGCKRILIKIGVLEEVDLEEITKIRKEQAGEEYNVFGFFVKDFIWSIGRFWTVVLSLIVCFLTFRLSQTFLKKRRLEDFILLFTIFQIPMNGVFYYRQSVSYMDVGILLCVLVYLAFKVFVDKNKLKSIFIRLGERKETHKNN